MIPDNIVNRTNIKDTYQNYDVVVYDPLTYRVRAGLDIRDADMGLDVADWVLWFDTELKTFNLDKDEKPVLDLGLPGYGRLPDGVAFAFDEEMRLYWGYAYLDVTGVYSERRIEFNWYNPQVNHTVKMILNNVHSMHVVLDDSRKSIEDTNDISLFYVRNSDRVVCARYQRDLFSVEYPLFLLRTGETFVRVDVTVNNVVQFEIGKLQKPYTWVKLLTNAGAPVYDHNRNPIWVVENTMSESYSLRPSLSDLSFQREIVGTEYFIINDKGEEKQLSLINVSTYLQNTLRLENYYKKDEANNLFSYKSDVYTRSDSHDLFEVKGAAYPRVTSDSRYAYKDTSYSKNDTDIKFAFKDEVYNRVHADTHFATKVEALSLVEADERYLQQSQYVKPPNNLDDYLSKEEAIVKYATADSVYTAGYTEANFVNVKVLEHYYTKEELEARLSVKERNLIPVKNNLIYNGLFENNSLDGWNTAFTYTDVLSPRSPYGAALYKGACKRLILDQVVPLLVDKNYYLVLEYRYVNKITSGVGIKMALLCYDKDNLPITGLNFSFDSLSVTRLAAPLKQGDTYIKLDTTDGWLSLDNNELGRGNILFFNYKNKSGFSYTDPKTPYTRNIAIGEYLKFKSSETSAADEFVNKQSGIIQLSKPWDYKNPNTADGSFPAGTRLARSRPYYGSDEFEFRCRGSVNKQYNSPDTGVISAVFNFTLNYNNTGRYSDRMLPPGTVYAKPVLYPNYNYMVDKTEYGHDLAQAPDANVNDIIAITQLYLRLDM